eukprot:gene11532-11675_t
MTEEDDAASLSWLVNANLNAEALSTWIGTRPCTDGLENLQVLDLSSNQLTGSIPANLSGPQLIKLVLDQNQLQGDSQVGLDALCTQASNLQVLSISGNPGLTGALPDSWGNLTALERLEMGNVAWVPAASWPAWSSMSNLSYLDLSNSSGYSTIITEPLPQSWFTGMTSLSTFICHSCKFAQAADVRMTAWRALRWLDISNNPLNSTGGSAPPGTILPAAWEQLNLTALKASGCNLIAANNTALANWSRLAVNGLLNTIHILDVADNPDLSFSSMEAFFGQMKLYELYVRSTNISGAGWANMPCYVDATNNTALGVPGCPNSWEGVECDPDTGRVTSINLSMALCSASNPCPLPSNMFSVLSALHTFSVSGANLQAKLDELDMGDSAMLRVLNVSSNPLLEGPLPASWAASLTSLVTLDLSGIQAMGQIPNEWAGPTTEWRNTLTTLRLSGASLMSSIPFPFHLTALSMLDLSHNNLTGLLLDVPNVSNLVTHLDLSSNQLTGTLVAYWDTSFGSLIHLNLSHNLVAGTLPTEWSSWTSIEHLDLSMNTLSGTLPDAWHNMTSLMSLRLSENKFIHVDVSDNAFSGTVPRTMTAWGGLQTLDVSNNMLTGLFGRGGCNLDSLAVLKVSHNQLAGQLFTTGIRYMGCYGDTNDRAFPAWLINGIVTVASCTKAAQDQGYRYFGLQNGEACFGGNDWASVTKYGPRSNCNVSCNGNISEICGGYYAVSVYRVANTDWLSHVDLSVLTTVDASHNLLSGSIPEFFGQLGQLYIDHNNFTGPVPSSFGTGSKVELLHGLAPGGCSFTMCNANAL